MEYPELSTAQSMSGLEEGFPPGAELDREEGALMGGRWELVTG